MDSTNGLCSLRDGVDALVMSAAWRPAALDVLRGAREGWTPVDLARWLLGPYSQATSHVPRDADEGLAETTPPRVDARRLSEILSSAASEVVAALECVRSRGTVEFVRAAIDQGAIVPTWDGFWLPIDKPRMLLSDRVLSLFAADYLLRPRDYVTDLEICAKCRGVVFDRAARQAGLCGAHRIHDLVEVLRPASQPPPRPSYAAAAHRIS